MPHDWRLAYHVSARGVNRRSRFSIVLATFGLGSAIRVGRPRVRPTAQAMFRHISTSLCGQMRGWLGVVSPRNVGETEMRRLRAGVARQGCIITRGQP
jgi:hypothetical protein